MSILESKYPLVFDTEALSLNPIIADVSDNPYNYSPKLLTTQVLVSGEIIIEKEWEIGERKVIEHFLHRMDRWANRFKDRRFMPFITYNGIYDYLMILGRMWMLKFPENDISKMNAIFQSAKNIDLLQFDKGYVISLDEICNLYNIKALSSYNGSDIKELYHKEMYDDIIAHGKDDVNRLWRLATETSLANRFFVDNIGVLDARMKNKSTNIIEGIPLDQIPDFMKYNGTTPFIVLSEELIPDRNVIKIELYTGLNFESKYDIDNKIDGDVVYENGLKVFQYLSLYPYGSLIKNLKNNGVTDTQELQKKFWDYHVEYYGNEGYCKLISIRVSIKQPEVNKNGVMDAKL